MKRESRVVTSFTVVGVVLAVGLVIGYMNFYRTAVEESADRFFTAIKTKNYPFAYEFLAQVFQRKTSEESFLNFLETSGLTDIQETSWLSDTATGSLAKIEGSVVTNTQEVIPVQLVLIKENGVWKIYSLRKDLSGVLSETTPVEAPSEQQLVYLVKDAMSSFSDSVKAKSMKKFHDQISTLWQLQSTPEALDESYGAVYDAGLDLSVLSKVAPVFEGTPTLTEQGELLVKGHFPTKPTSVHFEQKFVYEGLGWKLIGFTVKFV
ncbi:MAG: hypothetical protein HOI80_02630 [Alphaproteobacteria bacterium]|jgi:hypothetical protein|nr:hypothetical protein [Alphaproteobacteria bacterium]MBT5389823.1 hypothetical protein [Alphaproteobacteria bacterium]MBT5654380.1 hypothetical protein [Alphaproteobacteria bacterium]